MEGGGDWTAKAEQADIDLKYKHTTSNRETARVRGTELFSSYNK